MTSVTLERLSKCENFRAWDFASKTRMGDESLEVPAGPWDDEPDKVQWVDSETGLDCLIVRNHFGALCGYVGVTEGHPLFEQHYETPEVEIHGGLTFTDFCTPGEPVEGICHVAAPGRDGRVWWFGFDCAHAFDVQPGMLAFEMKHMPDLIGSKYEISAYRDIDYAVSETLDLAKQVAAAGSP